MDEMAVPTTSGREIDFFSRNRDGKIVGMVKVTL